MLYLFLYPLAEHFQIFNLFKYLTFRAGGAFLTSFFIYFFLGKPFIAFLKRIQGKGQPLRQYLNHEKKQGTPTMGGLLLLFSIILSVLLWADITNPYIQLMLASMTSFGMIGFIDDFLKIYYQNSDGMSVKGKFTLQGLVSVLSLFILTQIESSQATLFELHFPFFKNFVLNIGYFYFVFGLFVMVGASNAVNITDGLDGLVSFPLITNGIVFGVVSYLTGNVILSNYLQIPYIAGTGELLIFSATLVGGVLGFLWYNAPPARIFMGDTGSLALGGALGLLSLMTKSEFVLAISGGVFIVEALSDIIQIYSRRYFNKRVFLIAPLHHHFEKKGFSETTIVIRFWIVSILLAVLALSSFKIR